MASVRKGETRHIIADTVSILAYRQICEANACKMAANPGWESVSAYRESLSGAIECRCKQEAVRAATDAGENRKSENSCEYIAGEDN